MIQLRLMQSELTVEGVIKERSIKVSQSYRCIEMFVTVCAYCCSGVQGTLLESI